MIHYTRKLGVSSAAVTLVLLIASFELKEAAARDPLVETGVSRLAPDGTYVKVNAWPLLNMELETRGPNKGYRMTQSILGGLIGMSMDRSLDITGRIVGPVRVTLLGMALYDNQQARPLLPQVPGPAISIPIMQQQTVPAMPTMPQVVPTQA